MTILKMFLMVFCSMHLSATVCYPFTDPQSKRDTLPPSPLQIEINQVYTEIAKEWADKQKEMMETKDEVRKEKLLDELGTAIAKKIWPVVKKYPEERMAFVQLVGCAAGGHPEATDYLFEKFDRKDAAIGDLCLSLGLQHAARADRLCKIVLTRTKNENNRGRASLALAYWLMKEGNQAALKEQFDRSDKCHEEAKKWFEESRRKYGDQQLELGGIQGTLTIQTLAERSLYELSCLSIGQKVPNLKGIDLDGKSLGLTDYPNKVIMISFWAHWCGPCMAFIPSERALVTRMTGKPFVLLGVNGDDQSEQTSEKTRQAGITWRSFRNQESEKFPKISMQWNVITWPTIYLIDHQGRIRKKWIGRVDEKELNDAVDQLVDDARR